MQGNKVLILDFSFRFFGHSFQSQFSVLNRVGCEKRLKEIVFKMYRCLIIALIYDYKL